MTVNGEDHAQSRLSDKQRSWLLHIKRCEAQQETFSAYCQREGLNVKALYAARSALQLAGHLPSSSVQPPPMAAVRLTQASACGTVHIELPNGIRLSWEPHEAHDVHTLVAALNRPMP